MVVLLYSTLGAIGSFLSTIATGIVVIKLQRHWELSISSVRWLFYIFFLSICVWAALRCAFFLWMIDVGDERQVDPAVEKALTTTEQLDMIAMHSIPRSTMSHHMGLAMLMLAGDVALLASGLWIIALTYELGKLAIKSMDRGPKLEAEQIEWYKWLGSLLLCVYAVVELAIILRQGGYTKATHVMLLINLALHVCGLIYMGATLTLIKNRGKKYEPMHGIFVKSPVYQRLKRIMVVYTMFASQYHISSILLSAIGTRSTQILPYMGISLVLFTASGFALSVITICSQACVLQACGACVPEDLEAQFMQHKVCGSDVTTDSFGPPEHHPVFVYTDIESSSALWALAADGVMDKATDIHDNIIRSSLPRHDGYEITTCGDSFQLAFPTIQDAVAFCVDVQLQLLVAPWPKELHGLVPATKRQRSGHRLIFSGLRVRMGIHDSVDEDGVLVCERHAITGNMTYTGASEAIAGEVSELGRGGQILVTQRVAEWVQLHSDEMDVDLMVEYLDHYCMRVLEAEKPVYQIVPSILIGRRKYWPIPPQPMRSTLWSVSCVGTSPSVTTTTASLAPRSRSFPEIVIPTPPTPANTPKLHKSTSLMRISLDAIPESPVFVTNYVAWPSTK